MSETIVESLARTAPGAEIWWGTSPRLYPHWAAKIARNWGGERQAALLSDLRRLYDPSRPAESLFRGAILAPEQAFDIVQDNPDLWRERICQNARRRPGRSADQVFWSLYQETVENASQDLLPLYQASGRRFGFVSVGTDARLMFNEAGLMAQACRLGSLGPNLLVEIPVTCEGLAVITGLTALGISTHATCCFSLAQWIAAAEAVETGLDLARRRPVDLTGWRAVIEAALPPLDEDCPDPRPGKAAGETVPAEQRFWAGVAWVRQIYAAGRKRAYAAKMLFNLQPLGVEFQTGRTACYLEQVSGAEAVYTCSPKVFAQLLADPCPLQFGAKIWQPVPAQLTGRAAAQALARSKEPIPPEAFNRLPALAARGQEMGLAIQRAIQFVQAQVQDTRSRPGRAGRKPKQP